MVNQKRLAWMRREISRFTKQNEDEAWEFVLELLVTDWNAVAQLDAETRKESCKCCGRPFLIRLLLNVIDHTHDWTNEMKVCASCEQAVTQGYRVKCGDCKKKFLSHSYWYYDGKGGTKSYISQECPECDKIRRQHLHVEVRDANRTCIDCHNKFVAQYSSDISVCSSCRETHHITDRMIRIEYQKVNENNMRAERLDLPATLTLDEWFTELIIANWMCQYCLTSPYENLDHFIPLCKGGGTTADNCVPACLQCNKLKGQSHPDKVTSIPQESLDRVRDYLQQF